MITQDPQQSPEYKAWLREREDRSLQQMKEAVHGIGCLLTLFVTLPIILLFIWALLA